MSLTKRLLEDDADGLIRYVRVVLIDGAGFYLKVQKETDQFLKGIEVDREGEDISRPGTFDQRVRLIQKSMIRTITPKKMNLHYGILEGIGNWYYNLAPGTPVSTVAKLWASEGKKAYDDSMPQDYNPDDLWPYREFTRDVGVSYDPSIKASLMANGWQSDRPCHISLGRDGSIKVGEGNHRLALSRILGITKVPVVFHFQDRA